MAERLGHRGTRAVQRMVEYAPSTGGLALWVHHRDLPEGVAQPAPVSTDGATIWYDAGFEELDLDEQAGWVAHEVLHIALRHVQRGAELAQLLGHVDAALYNTCADAIVNSTLAHLSWLALPAGAVTLEALLRSGLGLERTPEVALLEWDVERLYRALWQQRTGRGREEQQRAEAAQSLQRSEHADLRAAPADEQAPEREAEAAREWAARLARAHAGDGAHSMLRTLLADLPRVRTPWEQVLRRQLARGLAPLPELSWSRPSRSYLANQGRRGTRRLPFEPGTGATRKVPRLAVIVDVSGSIDDALLQRFCREIEAIARRTGAGLTLVIGDDRVQRVERFAAGRVALRDLQFPGRGGTDFTPLLEEADADDPDVAVVLTDLDGPARHRPRCPVLWAVTEAHARAEPPFGRKLVLA